MSSFLIVAHVKSNEKHKRVRKTCYEELQSILSFRGDGERAKQRGEKQAIFSTCAERSNDVSRKDRSFRLQKEKKNKT